MDKKRDITEIDASKGLNADIMQVGPFGANQASAHAYKKTEKILVALHLITNFVPDSEPIRHAIRDKSLRILSDTLTLRVGLRSAGPEKVNDIIALVCEISSLLNILHASGFISNMNLDVLQRELSNLARFLRAMEDSGEGQSLELSSDYFTPEISKGHSMQRSVMSFNTKLKHKGQDKSPVKRTSSSQSHTERRSMIVSIIKDKKRVTVKDISNTVSDCSEKTIQRELIAMMREGVLKKEGERRWSTYSLV